MYLSKTEEQLNRKTKGVKKYGDIHNKLVPIQNTFSHNVYGFTNAKA